MQSLGYTAPAGTVKIGASSAPRSEHLEELTRRAQWVNHRAKRPIDPNTGQAASSTDPATWSTYNAALARVTAGGADGIGFVLTDADPYTVIDLDGCRDPRTGAVSPDALAIVEEMESYAEVSPSGTGIHIWLRASIPGTRNRTGKVEIYQTGRYMTVTGRPLPGYVQPIRESQAQLDALYARLFPQTVNTTPAAPVALTLEDADIIERIRGEYSGKGAALLRGDTGDYAGDYSRGREALAWKACFYTDDASQVARILRSSGMWRKEHDDKERDRRSMIDATKAVGTYTGARFDPSYAEVGKRLIMPAAAPIEEPEPAEDTRTVDQLRAELAAMKAERDSYRDAFNAVTGIVSVESLDASTRMTAIGVLLLGLEFQARGRKTSKQGDYHMPASWIGRYSGQKPQTVNRQLNRLQESGLIDREVRQERVMQPVEMVDDDGVIEVDVFEHKGNKNYIALPENVIDIVPHLTRYQKPEDAPKRGGARVPSCDKHPDAGIVRRTAYYCEVCFREHEHGHAPYPDPLAMSDPIRAHRGELEAEEADAPAPEQSHIKLGSDIEAVSIGDIKLASDDAPPLIKADPAPARIKLESDTDAWPDSNRETYGKIYRGEGLSA